MKKILILFLGIFLVLSQQLYSQILAPVKWQYSVKKTSDTEAQLIFKAKIDKGWHLYAQDFKEGGPIPLKFNFKLTKEFQRKGKVSESQKSHKEYDDIFDLEVKYFKPGEVTFIQKIDILTNQNFVVRGSTDAQACQDDGQCVLVGEDFEFKVEGAKNVIPNQNTDILPDTTKSLTNDTLAQTDTLKNNITPVNYNPNDSAKSVSDKVTANPSDVLGENASLIFLFWISFIAGLMAILTPCVFPMIPMTVTFFMKEKDGKGKISAIIYGLSIIVIYTVIGTLIAVLFGASFANWLSTHWLPNVIFFLVFMFFAASFLGMFEIVLPSWIVNKTDAQADKGGFFGPFFMALTLVVVSFSCTGPLVGAILVKSAGGKVLEPIIGMLGFSLAFALPFTFFAFFPSLLNKLPKSGGWLNSVKVVLGFIELALGLKFLSVADQTYHWGLLDRDIYIALWIVIFTLMGIYLIGKLKLPHDSDLKYISVPRLMLAIIVFTFVMYLIPGMFGAPLKALSGYLPPQTTHDFDLQKLIRDNAGVAGQEKSTICEKSKYSEFLHLPHGLEGYFDYEQGLACAKKQNKPVFIDFTGHGCVNCREMEAVVWSDPKVLQRLKEDFVVIALYVDDKTDLPEKDWYTSTYDKKQKTTIGAKYADFQISKFNVNAQPYYVLLDTNGEILVKPRAYNLNVDEFVDFLDKAKEEFAKRNQK